MNVIVFGCKDAKKYEYCHREEPKPTEQAAPKDDNEEITQPPKTLLKIKGQQGYLFNILFMQLSEQVY